MATYLQYGNYTHPASECEVTRTISPRYADSQVKIAEVERWDVRGVIIANGPVAIAARLNEIDNAYSVQGGDLKLLDDNGNILMQLRSVTSVFGVRSQRPNLPKGDGSEWATGLEFTASFEAEYTTGLQSGLVSFQETLAFSGGGPVHVWRRPLNGLPIKQTVAPASPYRLEQSGRAVGRYTYPTPPSPLFPEHLWEGPRIRYSGPEVNGQNYTVEWSYVMESVSPLAGLPTLPV
jgi:hypothetical protein